MPRPEITGFRQYYDVVVDTPGPAGGEFDEKKEVEKPRELTLQVILERLRQVPEVALIGYRISKVEPSEDVSAKVDIALAPNKPAISPVELNNVLVRLESSLKPLGLNFIIKMTVMNEDGSIEIGQLTAKYPLVTGRAKIEIEVNDQETVLEAGLEHLVQTDVEEVYVILGQVNLRLLPEKTFAGAEFEREEKNGQPASDILPRGKVRYLIDWIAKIK